MLTKNDLLVLGFLLERPMHGYEISQALKTEDVELWFEISTAAIYYSLNKLRRLSMIAEAHSRGNSGDRTIYHVTEEGREQFFTEMRRLLDSEEPIRTPYNLGIFMLNRLPRDQAKALLKRRIRFLQAWSADLAERYATSDIHPLQQAIIDHSVASAQLDVRWLSGIVEELEEGTACDLPFRGLMTLQGELAEFHLPDLIKLIASGKHSGTLAVRTGRFNRTVTFEAGRPHCASSQISDEPVADPQQVLGDIYQLFRWQDGTYAFDQRGCPQEGCVLLDVTADALILEGARRLDSWEIIQRIVPSSNAIFERRNGGRQPEALTLQEDEAEVFGAVNGFRDVTAVAQRAGLTEFETSKILYGLYAVDLVQPADPDKGRLRRVFREFAELMCRGALPYRTTPEEASECESEVNQRCEHLPVRIEQSRIVDETEAGLDVDGLAEIYRTFLQTQHAVLSKRLGKEIADELQQHVLSRISPDLRETLEKYALL
jgi:DNA-binding PadR family transcriptional regulator